MTISLSVMHTGVPTIWILLCRVFLLDEASTWCGSVFIVLTLYLAVGDLASVELSYSLSLSLSHQARLLEICNIVTGDCAAVCSRSGIGMFWTSLRIIVCIICTYLDTCGVAAVYCVSLITSWNSSTSHWQVFHLGHHLSWEIQDSKSASFRPEITRSLRNWASVSSSTNEKHNLVRDRNDPNLLRQSCWRNENHRSDLICHDLPVRFDRIVASLINVFVRDLHINYVHELSLNERFLSFQVSFAKRHYARLQYRKSDPNPLVKYFSQTLSAHRLNLRNLSLHRGRHINNGLCTKSAGSWRSTWGVWSRSSVEILRDLISFQMTWVIFSWVIGFVSARSSWWVETSLVDNVFVHGARQHLRRSPISRSMIPSCCRLSVVCLVEVVSDRPRSSLSGTGAPWVSLSGPRMTLGECVIPHCVSVTSKAVSDKSHFNCKKRPNIWNNYTLRVHSSQSAAVCLSN